MRTITMLCALAAPIAAQAGGEGYTRLLERALARATADVAQKHDVWKDHSTWENAWEARTEHFEVRLVQSYAWAKNIADGLEVMLEEFQRTLAIDFAPSQPFKVFVFPDTETYNAFGNDNGEHHSSFYGSFYASAHPERPVAAVWERDARLMRMQITHGVVHQYLDHAFPGTQAPLWVYEGLAAYFATYWAYDWTIEQLEKLRGRYEYVPLDRLLGDPIESYGRQTSQRFIELGALFYYLLRYRDDTRTTTPAEPVQRAPFRDYLLALLRGEKHQELPAHAVMNDLDALGEAFVAYAFPR